MSIDQLHVHIDKLEVEMDFIDNILMEKQKLTIKITGLNNLKEGKNDNWKNKLTQLFIRASIPIYWITNISPIQPFSNDNTNVNTVYIQAINNITKNAIKRKLKAYLAKRSHDT